MIRQVNLQAMDPFCTTLTNRIFLGKRTDKTDKTPVFGFPFGGVATAVFLPEKGVSGRMPKKNAPDFAF